MMTMIFLCLTYPFSSWEAEFAFFVFTVLLIIFYVRFLPQLRTFKFRRLHTNQPDTVCLMGKLDFISRLFFELK